MRLIFLHGLGQRPEVWQRTTETMDLDGGVSCPNLYSWLTGKKICYDSLYEGFSLYCSQFTESLNLCGLSLGGVLALHYAIENPDKVRGLALIGIQYKMPKGLLQLQNLFFHLLPKKVFQNMGMEKKDLIALCASMKNLDFQQQLKELSCPTLVLCGEKDRANKTAAMQLAEQLPLAEFTLLPGAGHEVNRDKPAELGRRLKTFLADEANSVRDK